MPPGNHIAPVVPGAPLKSSGPVSDTTPQVATDNAAKIAVLAEANAKAQSDLAAWFGEPRWPALQKQAAEKGLSPAGLESLCGKLVSTRAEWTAVKGNAKAALILAALHLLIELGSRPTTADEAALQAALTINPAS